MSAGRCFICAVTWENVPSDMCAQRRHKSACASAQSDQSPRRPHEETLHPWLSLSKMRPVKILIRLRECAVWSESSLGAYVRRYLIWRCGSLLVQVRTMVWLHDWWCPSIQTTEKSIFSHTNGAHPHIVQSRIFLLIAIIMCFVHAFLTLRGTTWGQGHRLCNFTLTFWLKLSKDLHRLTA